jgi:hypothetical protein
LQNGINLFRNQLPFILHDTVLNSLKGAPEYEQPEKDGDTSGVLMWDKNGPPPAELSQGSKVANATSPRLRMLKKPIKKNEAVSKLTKYILSINDEEAMK